MASGFVSAHRKIQPKQAKEFSPLKTAMILDHYSPNEEINIQIDKRFVQKNAEKIYRIPYKQNPQSTEMQPQQIRLERINPESRQTYQNYGNTAFQNQLIKSNTQSCLESINLHSNSNLQEFQTNFKKQLLKKKDIATDSQRRGREINIQDHGERVQYFSQPRTIAESFKLNQIKSVYQKKQGAASNTQTVLIQKPNTIKRQNKQGNLRKQQNLTQSIYMQQQDNRYFSQDPPQRSDPNLVPKGEDQELLQFQKEIERRYQNAQTKTYVFPRPQADSDYHSQSNATSALNESSYDYYTQELQNYALDQQNKLYKYQGLQKQKLQEKFCDKLKQTKGGIKPLYQSQSTAKIMQTKQQLDKNDSQSQFFQHTHKRINKKSNDHKVNNLHQENNRDNISSLIGSIMNNFPLTTKNSGQPSFPNVDNKQDKQQQASYFVNGKQEPQMSRNLQQIIEKNQGIFSQKQKQLSIILKQINAGNGGITSSFVDQNFNQKSMHNFFTDSKQTASSNQGTVYMQPNHSKKSSNISSPKVEKSSLQSSMKKTNKQSSPPFQGNTPSKTKALQKIFNSQNKNFKSIVSSYKSFKKVGDVNSSRTSRNSSNNKSRDHQNSNSVNRSSKKRANSKENLGILKQSMLSSNGLQPSTVLQQDSQKINNRSKTRKKLNMITSTLQVTGSQALKMSQEGYNAMLSFKSPQSVTSQQFKIPITVNKGKQQRSNIGTPFKGEDDLPQKII